MTNVNYGESWGVGGEMKIKSYKHKQTPTGRESQSFQLRRRKNVEARSSRSTQSVLSVQTLNCSMSFSPRLPPLPQPPYITSPFQPSSTGVPRLCTQILLQILSFHPRNQNKLGQTSHREAGRSPLGKNPRSKKQEQY